MTVLQKSKKINDGVGRRILGLRISKNLTQEAFGAKIGVSQGMIAMLEKGQRKPSEGLIITISVKFGVKAAWLRTGRNR